MENQTTNMYVEHLKFVLLSSALHLHVHRIRINLIFGDCIVEYRVRREDESRITTEKKEKEAECLMT